jgi:hypothetical protein
MMVDQIWNDAASTYIKAPHDTEVELERWSQRDDLDSTFAARQAHKSSDKDGFYDFVANLIVGNQAALFRTRGGLIGLACQHIAEGDKVVVLFGGHLPFILGEERSELKNMNDI